MNRPHLCTHIVHTRKRRRKKKKIEYWRKIRLKWNKQRKKKMNIRQRLENRKETHTHMHGTWSIPPNATFHSYAYPGVKVDADWNITVRITIFGRLIYEKSYQMTRIF